jgi:hypothetical protein
MIRFDFDVVSDPVPAKPVAPRPSEEPAARKREEGDCEPQPAAKPPRMARPEAREDAGRV